MASLSLGVDSFFDSLILIVKIIALFVQLGSYQQANAVSKLLDEYVLIESSNWVKFFQNRL